MPDGHICIQCGEDLSRLRIRREPHYGLPIVTCPSCGEAVVRRPHPLTGLVKTALRLDAACTAFAIHIVMMITLTAAIVGSVFEGRHAIEQYGWDVAFEKYWPMYAATFVILPMMLGAYLTAGFAHWKRRWLAGVIAAFWLASALIFNVVDEPRLRSAFAGGQTPAIGDLVDRGFRLWLIDLRYLAAMLPAAVLGIVPGLGVLWCARKFRWARYRWRRRQRGRKHLAV